MSAVIDTASSPPYMGVACDYAQFHGEHADLPAFAPPAALAHGICSRLLHGHQTSCFHASGPITRERV